MDEDKYIEAKVYFKPKKLSENGKLEFRPLHSTDLITQIAIVSMLHLFVYEIPEEEEGDPKLRLSNLSRLIPSDFYGNRVSVKPEYLFKPWKQQYQKYNQNSNDALMKYHTSLEYKYEVTLDLENFFPTINPIIIYHYVINHLPAYLNDEEIGAWKEDNEFDRKMIEQISGMEYSEFEAKARTMLSQNSEYLQLMNGNWKVCHKEELLNQCKNKLFDDSIGKLLEAVESILRQKSKCVASKMPYFIPVSGEYDNSLELRGNLVKSLCWVKKNLSELSQCNQEKIENNIYTLVSTLLQDAKWITWTSLRDCLQNLAGILRVIGDEFKREAKSNILEAKNGDDE